MYTERSTDVIFAPADNTLDERYSVITIMATQEQQERGNFLLELTSALNGVGVKIGRCIIQSCKSCGTPVNDPDYPADDENARLYKVWGTDRCVGVCRGSRV